MEANEKRQRSEIHRKRVKDKHYEGEKLVSGTLEALVEMFLPTSKYYPDRSYVYTFLLNMRLFVKPSSILSELGQVIIYQEVNTQEDRVNLCSNVLAILNDWVVNFPYDFLDPKLSELLKDICQNSAELCPSLKSEVGVLTSNLLARLASFCQYEEDLFRVTQTATIRLQHLPSNDKRMDGSNVRDILDVCPSSLTMAQQLTFIEMERLRHISPEEFVQAFANETSKLSTACRHKQNPVCVEAYTHWFNRLSYLVATEICMHMRKKHRVRVLEYFIDVAKECFNIGNFNSLMGIIAGLNMGQVSRLKRTWLKINTDKFEVLEHQMDPANNFHCYRSTLKAALWRAQGASDPRERIIIPFFSLFLKDLYFLNECSASRRSNGHINFEKCVQVAKQINDFMIWKTAECPFTRNDDVISYMLTTPIFCEDGLSYASFECEAPDNVYEKMTLQQLKTAASRIS